MVLVEQLVDWHNTCISVNIPQIFFKIQCMCARNSVLYMYKLPVIISLDIQGFPLYYSHLVQNTGQFEFLLCGIDANMIFVFKLLYVLLIGKTKFILYKQDSIYPEDFKCQNVFNNIRVSVTFMKMNSCIRFVVVVVCLFNRVICYTLKYIMHCTILLSRGQYSASGENFGYVVSTIDYSKVVFSTTKFFQVHDKHLKQQ